MKLTKEELASLKPKLILITFFVILVFAALLLPQVVQGTFNFLNLFTPLFYAVGIAFVLNIPMSIIERNLKRLIPEKNFFYNKIRALSIFFTLIFAFALIYIFIAIIAPQLIGSVQLLFTNAGNYLVSIVKNINNFLEYLHVESRISIDQKSINAFIESQGLSWDQIIQNTSTWMMGASTSIINNALAFTSELMTWFTGFMLSLYLLSNKETFIHQFRKLILAVTGYKASLIIFEWGTKANYIFSRFISGQLLEACILGTIYFVVLTLLNFPFAMLIACIIAVSSIVPMFGAMFGMAFGCLLILAVRPFIDIIWFIIVFQIVQTFEGNLIYPRVVGKSVGLPGLWVLLSLIIFGALWGLFGMLIAVPFTALIYKMVCEIGNYILKKRKIIVTPNNITQK
ncbi:MAG: AI-2E family transporter [Anaerorhabdus sp.]